jgi:hypothetical protein
MVSGWRTHHSKSQHQFASASSTVSALFNISICCVDSLHKLDDNHCFVTASTALNNVLMEQCELDTYDYRNLS